MSEITVELKTPFEYAVKGEQQKAMFIELSAPTFKQIDKVAPLKQAFVTAINDLNTDTTQTEQTDSSDSSDITGPQIMALMYQSSCNMGQVFLYAQDLFKDIAKVDGEARLTTPLMEKMDICDFERLVGEYLANFIAPSLMDGL